MNITNKFIDNLLNKQRKISFVELQQARCVLIDYLGVTVGGASFLQQSNMHLYKRFTSYTDTCSLIGSNLTATVTNAAFLNAFAAHVLELDDGHRHGMIHIGAPVISAILSVAEQRSIPFGSVLRGVVMGYEVAVRCARAVQPGHKMRGYHVSGTCGTIGAAMGVAFACGFDHERLKSTLSCAVSSAAGLLEIQEQASELKPYNVARAAMDGVMAAHMGGLGMPACDDILGGERGFLAAMTDTPNADHLTKFDNDSWAINGIYQKTHAACRHCHPAIDATLALRQRYNIKASDIGKIEVHTYRLAVGSHDHTTIRGIGSAKLSTPFSVALSVVRGSAGYADFNDDSLADPEIQRLTRCVRIIEDEQLTAQSSMFRGARVSIHLKDGDTIEETCRYPKGEPENPLTQSELEQKFRNLAIYGGLSETECNTVITEIWNGGCSLRKIMNTICRK